MTTNKGTKRTVLTQQELKENLHYDPETGNFTWIKNNGRKGVAGTVADKDFGKYYNIYFNRTIYLSHRLAWFYIHGYMPKNMIDHKDGDPYNNKIDNLREATCAENQQNQRKARKDNATG